MVQISLPASWIFFPNLKDFGFYDWLHYNKLFSVCFWILYISYFIKFPSQNFFLKWFCKGPWRVSWSKCPVLFVCQKDMTFEGLLVHFYKLDIASIIWEHWTLYWPRIHQKNTKICSESAVKSNFSSSFIILL